MSAGRERVDLDLAGLERAVQGALDAGDERGLHLLGYGEMTCVIAWPGVDGPWACKRLPVFHDVDQVERFRSVFDDYLAVLRKRGIDVHESSVEWVPARGGRVAVYCVQAMLPGELLAPARLRAADDRDARRILGGVIEHIDSAISADVGLDAQLSNWALDGDRLGYFDVTTPLLRDDAGRDRLETELFMATLPAFARPLVRRFALRGILDPYFDKRRATLDLLANLHKEDLAGWVPAAIELANTRLDTGFTEDEVARYYRSDARMWGVLQQLRRADRWWQRSVRRRPYPFLLPGKIDRNL